MDPPGTALSRHRTSLSSDRLLALFSQSPSSVPTTAAAGDELNEDDVFWTDKFSDTDSPDNHHHHHGQSPSFASPHRSLHARGHPRSDHFGILAALPEDEPSHALGARPIFYQKPMVSSSSSSSSSSARMIPAIPRPPLDRQLSASAKFNQSAPVNVPVLAKVVRGHRDFDDVDGDEDGDDGGGEMLPPHEIVARGSTQSPLLACSVLEGVGRTLKGRDLRQVRNAVWRRTGFID